MRRIETWIAIAIFVLLAGLAIAHGVTRLASLREARRAEIVDDAARALEDLTAGIRARATDLKRHARYVARLADPSEGEGGASSRGVLSAQLRALLASFPDIDRVRVLSTAGIELFRTERMGGGVASIPESLLAEGPDSFVLALARDLDRDAVAISGLHVDRDRVEVPESERKVVHYVACTPRDRALVMLTAYASPILDRVRRFEPVAGARSVMINAEGGYVASPDRDREMGAPSASRFDRDRPGAAEILSGATRIDAEGASFLARSTGELPWIVITEIPASALTTATQRLSRDSTLVLAGVAVALLLIVGAAAAFHRVARRALQLREAQAAVRDLERQREMERRLATTERLSALGLLTAGVAHEVNNPLEGIGNYLSLLENDGLDAAARKRHLDSVRHGFERIRDVMRRLLGFARPNARTGAADLVRVVARAAELARFSSQCRDVTFALPQRNESVVVPGDEGALEQVVMNLFLNAGTAMRGRGAITVAIVKDAGVVELRVEDDGPGIPTAHLDRLFDPFFTTGEGSGLGLAVSYGIAQAHGGTLSAANRPGGGARFVLRFPMERRA